MEDQVKSDLMSFTVMAKAVIYDAGRMRQFIEMMDTPDGAVQAVQTVVGIIEQKKAVPPRVAPLLAMNVYLLMVDAAANITGEEPDSEIVQSVVMQLMQQFSQSHAEPEPEAAEAGEPQQMQQQEMAAGTERPAGRGLIGSMAGV